MNIDPPVLSICIPTLRGHDRIAKCLRSIEAHTSHIDYEIVIVDSGSRGRGFPIPMNQALRAGRGRFLMSMNDDVEVTAGWIDPLLAAAADERAWLVAPDQRWSDGTQVMCGWCVVARREVWQQLDFYDERFWFWGQDIDLPRRAIMAGFPPVRVRLPSPLLHELNGTVRTDGLEQDASDDLGRYAAKWGVSCLEDKTQLESVDWWGQEL